MNGGDYMLFSVAGREVAGGMTMNDNFPPDAPPHWLVYFAVDDVERSVARVSELGGTALTPIMDSPGGRLAVVADPAGAAFGVIKLPT